MLGRWSTSPETAESATATDLASITIEESDRTGLVTVRGAEGSEYFVEAVRQELADLYPDGGLYTKGLRVYTTLDPAMQQAAFTSVTEVVDPRVDPDDPSASLVAIDGQGRAPLGRVRRGRTCYGVAPYTTASVMPHVGVDGASTEAERRVATIGV